MRRSAQHATDTILALTTEVVQTEQWARVAVAGELDLLTTPRLVEAIDLALERRPRALEVDLAAVTFVGAQGVRALLAAARRAQAQHTRLSIRPSRVVRRAFEALGLAAVLRDASCADDQVSRRLPTDAAPADGGAALVAGLRRL